MSIRREDIVGRRISRVLAGDTGTIYDDHLIELEGGPVILFSRAKLEIADLGKYSAVRPESPAWALGAPPQDIPAPPCEGRRIDGLLYSAFSLLDTAERHRSQVYLMLDDGRYLTSYTGFNYTELEADYFDRCYVANTRAGILYDQWTDCPVNPFGPTALAGDWLHPEWTQLG